MGKIRVILWSSMFALGGKGDLVSSTYLGEKKFCFPWIALMEADREQKVGGRETSLLRQGF